MECHTLYFLYHQKKRRVHLWWIIGSISFWNYQQCLEQHFNKKEIIMAVSSLWTLLGQLGFIGIKRVSQRFLIFFLRKVMYGKELLVRSWPFTLVHCQRDLMDLDHSYQPTLALGVLLQLCMTPTMRLRSDRRVAGKFSCPSFTAHQDGLSKITKEKNGFVFGSKKCLEFPMVQPTTLVHSSVNPTRPSRRQGRFSYCLVMISVRKQIYVL